MIEAISISTIATYNGVPEVLGGLKKVNFFFGANGSGKTTISRLIADESFSPQSRVTWKAGAKLKSLVYNQDFIEKNFDQSKELTGIFTLGSASKVLLEQIQKTKDEQGDLENRITVLRRTLSGEDGTKGKRGELSSLEDEFKERFWVSKQGHEEEFRVALKGTLNNRETFKTKLLDEEAKNKSEVLKLEDLQAKAETLFGSEPTIVAELVSFTGDELRAGEEDPILSKVVVGRDDVDIAAMIKRLGNSDWVQEGRKYFNSNEGYCPFCQQVAPSTLAQDLNDYFDESFKADLKAIETLAKDYTAQGSRVQGVLEAAAQLRHSALDSERLKAVQIALDTLIASNLMLLNEKIRIPSQIVILKSTKQILTEAKTILDQANSTIRQQNKMVDNLPKERATLVSQIWKFLVEVELKADLEVYHERKTGLTNGISALELKLKEAQEELRIKTSELLELEKQTTSVKPTVDGINRVLNNFGFNAFRLAIAPGGTAYQLLREDGTEAKKTLSEGEKSFVCFLYFYFSIAGSTTNSGITEDRVVVIDDPVSSLDSEVLFVVSTLIKDLLAQVLKGDGPLKQIFLLTHNVYFHKEITHKSPKAKGPRDETFWVVRKRKGRSNVICFKQNPVKSSYDLLWEEIRSSSPSMHTIQNTMRRILEHYFKILGGIDFDDIYSKFEGSDKLICQSLISWTHDGSHSIQDDLSITVDDDAALEANLRVFKAIFDGLGQIAHYRMMMGEAMEEPA